MVATTPSHRLGARVASRIDGDDNFAIDLEPGYAWVLTFADSRQVGAQMIEGTLQAGSLDALVPQGAGSLDLGTVSIENGRGKPTAAWSDITAALGLDSAVADRLGAARTISPTRYANPDMDGDGVIDALQADRDFRLDFYGTLRVTVDGNDATIEDLVRGNITGNVGVHYLQTGIVASMPRRWRPGCRTRRWRSTRCSTARSSAPRHPASSPAPRSASPSSSSAPPTAIRPPRCSRPQATTCRSATTRSRSARSGDVRRRPPEQRHAVACGRQRAIVPFLKLVPTEADCLTDCHIQTISYQWMRNTAAGWVAADATELAQTAHLDIVRSYDGAMQYLGLDLAATPQADIAWSAVPMAEGMTRLDLAGITTGELCYVSVTYDDQIGVQTTSMIANPAAGCTP